MPEAEGQGLEGDLLGLARVARHEAAEREAAEGLDPVEVVLDLARVELGLHEAVPRGLPLAGEEVRDREHRVRLREGRLREGAEREEALRDIDDAREVAELPERLDLEVEGEVDLAAVALGHQLEEAVDAGEGAAVVARVQVEARARRLDLSRVAAGDGLALRDEAPRLVELVAHHRDRRHGGEEVLHATHADVGAAVVVKRLAAREEGLLEGVGLGRVRADLVVGVAHEGRVLADEGDAHDAAQGLLRLLGLAPVEEYRGLRDEKAERGLLVALEPPDEDVDVGQGVVIVGAVRVVEEGARGLGVALRSDEVVDEPEPVGPLPPEEDVGDVPVDDALVVVEEARVEGLLVHVDAVPVGAGLPDDEAVLEEAFDGGLDAAGVAARGPLQVARVLGREGVREDREPLREVAPLRRVALEAREEDVLHGGRERGGVAVLPRVGRVLAEEEGVAHARLEHAGEGLGRGLGPVRAHQGLGLGLREGRELQGLEALEGLAELGRELASREDEEGLDPAVLEEVLEELAGEAVHERRVVDADEDREEVLRVPLEDRVEDVVEGRDGDGRGVGGPGLRAPPLPLPFVVVPALADEVDEARGRGLGDLRQGVERRPGLGRARVDPEAEVAEDDVDDDREAAGPVLLRPGREDRRGEVGEEPDLLDEGLHEPGLARARLPEEVEARDLVVAVADVGLEHLVEELPAPHEGPRVAEGPRVPALDREGRDGLGLALGLDAPRLRELEVGLALLLRGVGDEDLAGLRGGLEALRDAHGVAGHHVELAPAARRDETGVDAGAEGEAALRGGAEARVGLARAREEFQGRVHGARGVVLVELGHAEDRDEGVADVLLDDAAVGAYDRLEEAEDPRHEGVHLLGVHALGEAGEALHVREEDGGDAPLAGLEVVPVGHHRGSSVHGRRAAAQGGPAAEPALRGGSAPRRPGGLLRAGNVSRSRTPCPGRGDRSASAPS